MNESRERDNPQARITESLIRTQESDKVDILPATCSTGLKTSKKYFFSRVLAVLLLVAVKGCLATPAVQTASLNTLPSEYNILPTIICSTTETLKFTIPSNQYKTVHAIVSVGDLRLLSTYGSSRLSTSVSLILAPLKIAIQKGTRKLYVFLTLDSKILQIQIDDNFSIFGIATSVNEYPFSAQSAAVVTMAVSQGDSNYLFACYQATGQTNIIKFDTSMPITSDMNQQVVKTKSEVSMQSPSMGRFLTSEVLITAKETATSVFLISYLDLTTIKEVTGFPVSVNYLLVDNIGFTNTFIASEGFTQINSCDLLASATLSFTSCTTQRSGIAPPVSLGILNVGVYNMLAGVSPSTRQVLLFSKTDLTSVGPALFFGEVLKTYDTTVMLTNADLVNVQAPAFAVFQTVDRILQIFMIVNENCLLRDATFICIKCNSGEYLNSLEPWNYCLLKANFLTGYGPFEGDSTFANINMLPQMKSCQLGCLSCANDYQICTLCDIAKFYYLDSATGLCSTIQDIPQGKGVDLANGNLLANCMTGCLQCQTDVSKCTQCNVAAKYYLNTAGVACVSEAAIPASQGINPVTKSLSNCASGCLSCTLDSFYCTSCDTAGGFFMSAEKTCISESLLPKGFRANVAEGIIEPCAPGCSRCPAGKSVCTECFLSNNYYLTLAESKCTLNTQLPDGLGADLATGHTQACQVAACKKCQADAAKCEFCLDKFVLNTATFAECTADTESLFGELVEEANALKSPATSISFVLRFVPSVGSAAEEAALCKLVQAKLALDLTVTSPSGKIPDPQPSHDLVVAVAGSSIVVDLTFRGMLNEKGKWRVDFVHPEKFVLAVSGKQVVVLPIEMTGHYLEMGSLGELQASESQGAAVAALAPQSSGGVEATLTLFAFISLDPTGLLMRVSQILQVVSKLAFINIHFGVRLGSFMKKLGEMFEGFGDAKDPKYVLNSPKTRGKLSRYRVKLDLVEKYLVRMTGYYISWTLRIAAQVLMWLRRKKGLPRWLLVVFYYLFKLHSLQFNLVFFDLIFYSARTIMHARGLLVSQVFGFLSMLLLSLDVINITSKLIEENNWVKLFKIRAREMPQLMEALGQGPGQPAETPAPQQPETKTGASANPKTGTAIPPVEELTSEESETEEERKHRRSQPIDFEKTFREINFDPHTYEFLSEFLRIDPVVYFRKVTRSYYVLHVVRISLYHSVIVVGQYMNGFVICSLLGIEAVKILYTLVFYIKKKHLKYFVMVFMETSQSIFLGMFLCMAWVIKDLPDDKAVGELYQDIGIYSILGSCVMEYVLLLIYLVVYLVSNIRSGGLAHDLKKKQFFLKGILHPKKVEDSFIVYRNLDREKRVGSQTNRGLRVEQIVRGEKGLLKVSPLAGASSLENSSAYRTIQTSNPKGLNFKKTSSLLKRRLPTSKVAQMEPGLAPQRAESIKLGQKPQDLFGKNLERAPSIAKEDTSLNHTGVEEPDDPMRSSRESRNFSSPLQTDSNKPYFRGQGNKKTQLNFSPEKATKKASAPVEQTALLATSQAPDAEAARKAAQPSPKREQQGELPSPKAFDPPEHPMPKRLNLKDHAIVKSYVKGNLSK